MSEGFSGEAMYREHIMDHYANPRNKGTIDHPSAKHHDANPLCGDAITITITIQDNQLTDIKFDGVGCAISQAAASILTEFVEDKTLNQILTITREDMLEQLGVIVTPARVKCGMLALSVLKTAITNYQEQAK